MFRRKNKLLYVKYKTDTVSEYLYENVCSQSVMNGQAITEFSLPGQEQFPFVIVSGTLLVCCVILTAALFMSVFRCCKGRFIVR